MVWQYTFIVLAVQIFFSQHIAANFAARGSGDLSIVNQKHLLDGDAQLPLQPPFHLKGQLNMIYPFWFGTDKHQNLLAIYLSGLGSGAGYRQMDPLYPIGHLFQVLRKNIAAGKIDHLFDPAADSQPSLFDKTYITGSQPAIVPGL